MRHVRASVLLPAVLLAVAIACGADSGIAPPPAASGPMVVRKLSGDSQRAPVTVPLGAPLVAQAYIDTTHGARAVRLSLSPTGAVHASDTAAVINLGVPLKNRQVTFTVVDPACGRPFSTAEVTDSMGVVKAQWELGTKAGQCTMEVRAVDQTTGNKIVYATFTAIVEPGAFFSSSLGASDLDVHVGDTLKVRSYVQGRDRYGNTLPNVLVETRMRLRGDVYADSTWSPSPTVVVGPNDWVLEYRVNSTSKPGGIVLRVAS